MSQSANDVVPTRKPTPKDLDLLSTVMHFTCNTPDVSHLHSKFRLCLPHVSLPPAYLIHALLISKVKHLFVFANNLLAQVDWKAVAIELGYASPESARVRFTQVKQKLGLGITRSDGTAFSTNSATKLAIGSSTKVKPSKVKRSTYKLLAQDDDPEDLREDDDYFM